MPITPNLTIVPVSATYVDVEGNPIAGQVKFTPRAITTDSVYNQIIVNNTITVTLDNTGSFTVYLPATNDPDVVPTGWTYEVVEAFPNGRTYDIEVPYTTVGTLNLATLVPTTANAGVASLYTSLAQYFNVENRVTIIEGYSASIAAAAVTTNYTALQSTNATAQAVNASAQATIAAQNLQSINARYFNPLFLAGV